MATNKLKSIMLLMAIFFSFSMNAFEVDGIAYEVTSTTDMTVEVIAKDGGYSGDVVIPETITYNDKTYTVTAIKDCDFYDQNSGVFSNCTDIISISFPKTITSIGNNAFWHCSSLTSISIPNSVKYIGGQAFLIAKV